nr:Aminopeptidase N [Klebsiella pneumoniae]
MPLCPDGEDLTLIALQVNGQPWSHYKEENNQLVIGGLPEHFTLTIVNEISPAANTALEGLYQSGEALCTQCEAEGFRHITGIWTVRMCWRALPPKLSPIKRNTRSCFPTATVWRKGSWRTVVTGYSGRIRSRSRATCLRWWPVILTSCAIHSAPALAAKWRWSCTSIAATSIARPGDDLAENSMKWDEERFGLEYDLDIYMIVAVDFFNMGAMENKGLNVFNSKYVLARTDTATDKDYLDIERVIGHEYFHNWTGNRVTCRDWFQLSLKEGLTVFRDQEFSSDLGSRAVNRINNVRTMRGLQFAEDASPMAHPIRPDMVIEMNNFYTLTVYEKGAEVIRMLHTLLGEENFQKGMQLYFERHDGSAATCDDFVQAMEDASNVDLSHFRLWYSQSGTPIVTVHDDYNPETEQYTLTISQRTPPTAEQAEKQPLHIPFAIELYDNEGKVIPCRRAVTRYTRCLM